MVYSTNRTSIEKGEPHRKGLHFYLTQRDLPLMSEKEKLGQMHLETLTCRNRSKFSMLRVNIATVDSGRDIIL